MAGHVVNPCNKFEEFLAHVYCGQMAGWMKLRIYSPTKLTLGEEKYIDRKVEEETTGQNYNGLFYSVGRR